MFHKGEGAREGSVTKAENVDSSFAKFGLERGEVAKLHRAPGTKSSILTSRKRLSRTGLKGGYCVKKEPRRIKGLNFEMQELNELGGEGRRPPGSNV